MLFERSIFTVSVLATAAFLAAGLAAYAAPPQGDLARHVLYGLAAALLVVFPHLWTLIYLWTTGRAAAAEVSARRASPRLLSRVRRNRRRALPPLLIAAAGALGTVALGQNALVQVQGWAHAATFFATLAAQLWALWAERKSLWDNAALLADLDERATALADGLPVAPEPELEPPL